MESEPDPKPSLKAKSVCRESDRRDGFFVSCWGHLQLMRLVQWTKRKSSRTARRGAAAAAAAATGRIFHPARPATSIAASLDCKSIADSLSVVQPRPVAGGFKYDPLSYSQNFDEGTWHEHDLEAYQRGFSSRYAAPSLVPTPRPPPPPRSLIDE